MKTKTNAPATARSTVKTTPGSRLVRLRYTDPSATRVCIAGTFNDWHPSVTEMLPLGAGEWAKDLILADGVYEYRFVVDGRWLPDPVALETALNPFGGVNSVIRVG